MQEMLVITSSEKINEWELRLNAFEKLIKYGTQNIKDKNDAISIEFAGTFPFKCQNTLSTPGLFSATES